MAYKIKNPQDFGRSPRKGTLSRKLLILMLRPQGLTMPEVEQICSNPSALAALSHRFRDDKGWDIRVFKMTEEDPRYVQRIGRKNVVYRVVGKMRWDGSYRSFIDPNKNRPSLHRQR